MKRRLHFGNVVTDFSKAVPLEMQVESLREAANHHRETLRQVRDATYPVTPRTVLAEREPWLFEDAAK